MASERFLFLSADAALITDLAWQVHREGHDVKYSIEAETDREIGDGFVPKTDDWRLDFDGADVGYPTIALQKESFESPTGEFFAALARGVRPELSVHEGYQVGVRVVLPPFSVDNEATDDESSRNAAVAFRTENREGIHIEDAKWVDGQWRVAGETGMPFVETGMGEPMRAARAQADDRIDDVLLPNLCYRDHIGERRIAGDGDRLQAWGSLGPPNL